MKKSFIAFLLLVLVSCLSFGSGSKEQYLEFDQNDVITDGRLNGIWVQEGMNWVSTYTFSGSEFLYKINWTDSKETYFQTYHGTFILTSTHIHFEAIQDENWPYSHSVTRWSQGYSFSGSGNRINLSQTIPIRFQNGQFIKQ
jgi:hypothetical protein